MNILVCTYEHVAINVSLVLQKCVSTFLLMCMYVCAYIIYKWVTERLPNFSAHTEALQLVVMISSCSPDDSLDSPDIKDITRRTYELRSKSGTWNRMKVDDYNISPVR